MARNSLARAPKCILSIRMLGCVTRRDNTLHSGVKLNIRNANQDSIGLFSLKTLIAIGHW